MYRKEKIVKVKNIKNIDTKTMKVKFRNNTSISWTLYKKDQEYNINESFLSLIKNFIY